MEKKNPVNISANTEEVLAENVRLKKMVRALMDRAERQVGSHDSSFNLFQAMVVLEDNVRQRTSELETLLHENESITRALRISEEKYRALVTNSMIGIGIFEEDRAIYANEKLADIFGHTVDGILQSKFSDFFEGHDLDLIISHFRKALSGEDVEESIVLCGNTNDGREIFVELSCEPLQGSEKSALVFICVDITQRVLYKKEIKALNRKLQEMAIRDDLTGLFNRRYLNETLVRELARAKRNNEPLSVIMCDLDHFKAINDTAGHLAGDRILNAFGELIMQNARASDYCCRYGGEEFMLICTDMAEDVAIARAEQLREATEEKGFTFGGAEMGVTASFGIAVYPQHGSTPEELVMVADDALYRAKREGRNQVWTATKARAS